MAAHRTVRTPAAAAPFARAVLAHGAGAGKDHPFLARFAAALAERGVEVLRFDFPYMAAGRRVPDRGPVLEAALAQVVAEEARDLPLFVGGKSMGGRIASQAAARGLLPGVRGLFFLGYPLHPPGRPAQRRDAHLPNVGMPLLFVQGARDAFGDESEVAPLAARLGAALHVVPYADHSFAVRRKDGGDGPEVLEAAADAVAAWMRATQDPGVRRRKVT
jgi:predicted alpha/beta-hydrolase family hydrolase